MGDREYMLFLILFGMTSSRTRCVRISANPPKNDVRTKVEKINAIGKRFSTGRVRRATPVNGQ